ncbi:hypothetical protein [Streptomyces chryseus]|uniref:Uncharacterized protein n=1 Tax=Streptomyces chryseus TaxID=68186 RepID=A0ABQ3DHM7_9ACTN|nr:hypothetical protein [Streptomyces chryseus]GHA93971.1 hypothetical protein GCM10010346_15850 [Streptomyces chryseus]
MSRALQVRAAAVSARREYCRCTTVRNYRYPEAADKLGCKEGWLRDHISSLPHQRIGEAAVFCECELAIIQALCSVMPTTVELALTQAEAAPTSAENPAANLRTIRPAQGRKRGA